MAPHPEREAEGDVGLDMERKEELIMAKRLRACRVTILPKGPGISRGYLPEAPQQPAARREAQPITKKVAAPSPAAMAAASNPIALRYWSQCLALTAPSPPAGQDQPPPPPRHDELPPWATPDAPAPPSPPAPAPPTVPDMGRRVGRGAGPGKWGPGARTDWGAVLREEEEGRAPGQMGARPWGQQLRTQAEERTGKHLQTSSFHDQRVSTTKKVDKMESSSIRETTSNGFNNEEVLASPDNIEKSNETSPSSQMRSFQTNSKTVRHYALSTTKGERIKSENQEHEKNGPYNQREQFINNTEIKAENIPLCSKDSLEKVPADLKLKTTRKTLSPTKGDVIKSVTQEHQENYFKNTKIKAENTLKCSKVSLEKVNSVPADPPVKVMGKTGAAPPQATVDPMKEPNSKKQCCCSHGISCLPSLSSGDLAQAQAISRPQAIDSVMLALFQSTPPKERTGIMDLLLGALESEQLVEVMSSLLAKENLGKIILQSMSAASRRELITGFVDNDPILRGRIGDEYTSRSVTNQGDSAVGMTRKVEQIEDRTEGIETSDKNIPEASVSEIRNTSSQNENTSDDNSDLDKDLIAYSKEDFIEVSTISKNVDTNSSKTKLAVEKSDVSDTEVYEDEDEEWAYEEWDEGEENEYEYLEQDEDDYTVESFAGSFSISVSK